MAVGLLVTLGLVIVWRTQTLIRMLAVSVFFALAMIPAVKYLHERWGWKRGAAVGAIYLGFVVFIIALVAFMIPAAVDFAGRDLGERRKLRRDDQRLLPGSDRPGCRR